MVKNAREVLLLTQSVASIPFDLQGFRCIRYNSSEEGTRKLKEDLARALKEITSPVYRFVIKPRASIEFSHRLLGDGNCLYDFTVFADFLGVDAAKITLQVRRYVAGKENAELLEKNFLGISRDRPVRIPNLPWELRLDSTGNESDSLSVIRCSGEPSRRRPADRPKRGTGAVVALEGEIKSDRRIEFVMDLAFGAQEAPK